jgi:hypothetical protein
MARGIIKCQTAFGQEWLDRRVVRWVSNPVGREASCCLQREEWDDRVHRDRS